MKYSELQPGQIFTLIAKKTPHGYMTVDDGLTHYQIDEDAFVSLKPANAYRKQVVFAILITLINLALVLYSLR